MPLAKKTTDESRNRSLAKTLLAFGHSLIQRLEDRPTPGGLQFELETHVTNVRLDTRPVLGPHADDLDSLGTKLWNISTRLLRDDSFAEKDLTPILRIFAFQLLDRRQPSSKLSTANLSRLLRIGNKTARFALDKQESIKEPKIIGWLLERVADYDGALIKSGSDSSEEAGVLRKLHLDYLQLRVAYASQIDRLDVASAFFEQMTQAELRQHPEEIEKCADLCYEIGKSRHEAKDPYKATKWLERAYDVLQLNDEAALSDDAMELRLCILQQLIRANLAVGDEQRLEKAAQLVLLLENEYPNRILVPLLNLEILAARPVFDAIAYFAQVQKLVNSGIMTQPNFKTILAHVHILKDHDADLAVRAIDILITARLLDADRPEWIEKACVTRVWLTTEKLSEASASVRMLSELLTTIRIALREPMTAKAAHACQTLLWKRIESSMEKNEFSAALDWCNICTHDIFNQCGEINKERLARKKLSCLLQLRDVSAALQVYNEMSESARKAPLTNYLAYKLAAIQNDHSLASEAITALSKCSAKDTKLLYACVLEAQSSGDKQLATDALRAALQRIEHADSTNVHKPALLRTTLHLFLTELDSKPQDSARIAPEICDLLDKAAKLILGPPHASITVTAESSETRRDKEVKWFMTTAYNLALKHHDDWSRDLIASLFSTCLRTQFAATDSDNTAQETSPYVAICHFFLTTHHLRLAREEPDKEKHLQEYLTLQTHAKAFEESARISSSSILSSTKCTKPDIASRQANLSSLRTRVQKANFEAAIHLKQWDTCTNIITSTSTPAPTPSPDSTPPEIHKFFVDAILASSAPVNVKVRLLNTILSTSGDSVAVATRAKWCRVLFTLSSSQDLDTFMGIIRGICHVIDTVTSASTSTSIPTSTSTSTVNTPLNTTATVTAKSGKKNLTPYPREEIEYLATTTFNAAVDAYCSSDEQRFRRLSDMALLLAARVEDGGCLRAVLMNRLGRMKWEGEGT